MSGLSRSRQNCFGVRAPILSPQPPAGSTAATVPGRLPGCAPAADGRSTGNAGPSPGGPLTQRPGSAGLLRGPGSIASGNRRSPGCAREPGAKRQHRLRAAITGRGGRGAAGAKRAPGTWPPVLIRPERPSPSSQPGPSAPEAALFLLFLLSPQAGPAGASVAVLTHLKVTHRQLCTTLSRPPF